MSKSLGNALALGASPEQIRQAVRSMFTDPGHLRVEDPGRVEGNVVFAFLDAFDPRPDEVEALKAHYRRGGLGDGALKARLEERLQEMLRPIRERRGRFAQEPAFVAAMLREGTAKARERAAATLGEVRRSLGLVYF